MGGLRDKLLGEEYNNEVFRRHYHDEREEPCVSTEDVYDILNITWNRLLDEVYEQIKHGDAEHQKWLKNKLEEIKKGLETNKDQN